MFELRSTSAGQWSVVDDDGEPVYVDSLRQCEDWLDRHENRLRSSKPGVRRRLWLRVLHFVFGRSPRGTDANDAPEDRDADDDSADRTITSGGRESPRVEPPVAGAENSR